MSKVAKEKRRVFPVLFHLPWNVMVAMAILCSPLSADEPAIIRLQYQQCADTDDYSLSTTNLYHELSPVVGLMSDTWGIGATACLTLTFVTPPGTKYCIESTPRLGDWSCPWMPVSGWINADGTNTFQHGVLEGSGFYRIRIQ